MTREEKRWEIGMIKKERRENPIIKREKNKKKRKEF